MKTLKIFLLAVIPLVFFACSEDLMDEINKDRNNLANVAPANMLPDAMLKTAFETTGTDIAWYATVYIEHSTGTWAQSATADKRQGQNDASLFNNNWNELYDLLNTLQDIRTKTSEGGEEPDNTWARGIAEVLTAYNLGVLTDMWGEVPWTEACKGTEIMKPKYDKQSFIYGEIQRLLDAAITDLSNVRPQDKNPSLDYIYAGNEAKWIKAAWALKARYYIHLTGRDNNAAQNALSCISKAFASNADNFLFAKYEASATGENPWYQFLADRSHLSAGKTLFDLMKERNDPRILAYFTPMAEGTDTIISGSDTLIYYPAPNGEAGQTQGGTYSTSLITENGATAPTPLMTYHELKFIEAEAKFRTGDNTWKDALQEAIQANFTFHGLTTGDANTYFTNDVEPRLTAGNELKEILTQKYIAFYEHEAIEAYNDYRRTGIPEMKNPNNLAVNRGFVHRFPYALSETSANPDNVPQIDVYRDKVWWAGGNELVK